MEEQRMPLSCPFPCEKDAINRRLDKIEKAIYGNGKPGINDHLVQIDLKLNEVIIRQEERKRTDKSNWIIISFFISTAISLLAIFYTR